MQMRKGKPMLEIEIMPGGRSMEDSPVAEELNELEMEDEDTFAAMAPKGKFTSRSLDPLVKNVNKVLPLFGQDPSYPAVGDTDVLPTDLTRILSMIVEAVSDAVDEGILDPEMNIMLETIRSDQDLMALSGKLEMLSKSREFKKFLSEEMAEEESPGMEEGMDEMEMSPEEEDALLMSRM